MSLPAGVSPGMVWAVLIPVAVVTLALRALPFAFKQLLRGSPLLDFLGIAMPVGVMTVLVVYSISGTHDAPGGVLAALIAAAVTFALHAWRRSMALSIIGGTACYMLLVNCLF